MSVDSELLQCQGGRLILPAKPMLDGSDGGHLVVLPPRPVWDRTVLLAAELYAWQALVSAAAQAMLQCLPQLQGGCINYWDAGNWALNQQAAPAGRKTAAQHRQLHLHLLGRSPNAKHPSWRWGESPQFPLYADRLKWGENFKSLTQAECAAVALCAREVLRCKFAIDS